MRSTYWSCFSPACSPAYAAACAPVGRAHWRKRPRTWMETRSRHHRSSGADFGVRRPLRHLRYHLDLDEGQTRRVAAVLNRLKLEREQAGVDSKRAMHSLADLLLRDDSNVEQFAAALAPRVKSAERLQAETARALAEIAEVLDLDQRQQLADMVRSGLLSG